MLQLGLKTKRKVKSGDSSLQRYVFTQKKSNKPLDFLVHITCDMSELRQYQWWRRDQSARF